MYTWMAGSSGSLALAPPPPSVHLHILAAHSSALVAVWGGHSMWSLWSSSLRVFSLVFLFLNPPLPAGARVVVF